MSGLYVTKLGNNIDDVRDIDDTGCVGSLDEGDEAT